MYRSGVARASGRRVAAHARRALATRPPLRRLLWALQRLRSGNVLRAPDVAREFEVAVRTAYRDFDFLRDEWRVPLEFDHHRRTYRLTEPVGSLPLVSISQGELLAIYFAEKVLRQYRGTPFEGDLASAFSKMQEMLPEQVNVSPDSLDGYVSLDLGPVSAPEATVFRDILIAQRLRRRALVRYRSLSSGRTTDRRIHPYHVFNLRGQWYLAASDENRKEVRDFAIHRVRRVTLMTDGYEIPRAFDFGRYMADAFGIEKGSRPLDVAVRFAPPAKQGGSASGSGTLPHASRKSCTGVLSSVCEWLTRANCVGGSSSSAPRLRSWRRPASAALSPWSWRARLPTTAIALHTEAAGATQCRDDSHAADLAPDHAVLLRARLPTLRNAEHQDVTLQEFERRLLAHFDHLRRNRPEGKPIFALEHGLEVAEVRDLATAICAHVLTRAPSSEHSLSWIVYASELGYRYAGDEYWQTFEEATPGWVLHGKRQWLRERFQWFHQRYQAAKPTGSWAGHFSIICWPITHAVLPRDLQRQLARVLYQLRHAFSADLLASPGRLGEMIAAKSWEGTSRFQNLAQETPLIGQIAAALLLEGQQGSAGLLLPSTLRRIGADLDRERAAREWLRGARSLAQERGSFHGLSLPRTLGAVSQQRAREVITVLGIEPRLLLRPREVGGSSWDVFLELPDLQHLLLRFPEMRGALVESRCTVAGAAGRPLVSFTTKPP